MAAVKLSTLWRSALVQALAVGALFALLVALPLSPELFRESGALIGPVSWLLCSLVTARVLSLTPGRALAAAVGSGLAAVAASAVLGHLAGMIVGVLAFGVVCSIRLTTHGEPSGGRAGPSSGRRAVS